MQKDDWESLWKYLPFNTLFSLWHLQINQQLGFCCSTLKWAHFLQESTICFADAIDKRFRQCSSGSRNTQRCSFATSKADKTYLTRECGSKAMRIHSLCWWKWQATTCWILSDLLSLQQKMHMNHHAPKTLPMLWGQYKVITVIQGYVILHSKWNNFYILLPMSIQNYSLTSLLGWAWARSNLTESLNRPWPKKQLKLHTILCFVVAE